MPIGKKSKPSYLYAIIGVSLVLFLLGTLGWLVINGRSLIREFKENITITADFHDNIGDDKILALQQILDKQPFIRHTGVTTKEQALKIVNQTEGDNVDMLTGVNPLFASMEMNVYS